MFRRFSYVLNLMAARERVASGEYSRALEAVCATYRIYRCNSPSTKAPTLINIMCALVAWNLQNPAMTFDALAISADQLARRTPKKRRARRNNKYLLYYCKYLLQFAEHDFDYSPDRDLSELRLYKRGSIDVTKVDNWFRETFPIDRVWLASEWGMGSGS
jgi:hypothetical protein